MVAGERACGGDAVHPADELGGTSMLAVYRRMMAGDLFAEAGSAWAVGRRRGSR